MQTITYRQIFTGTVNLYDTFKNAKTYGKWLAFKLAVQHFFRLTFIKLMGRA